MEYLKKATLTLCIILCFMMITTSIANADTSLPKTSITNIKHYANSSAKISWKKSANTASYKIYRSNSKSTGFKLIKTTSNTTYAYINKSLKKNKTYYYKVKAINEEGKGNFSSVKSIKLSSKKIVSSSDKIYSYGDMKKDIQLLASRYPYFVSSKVISVTADKRNVYAICLGNPNAKKQVVVTSSIHAREYRNTQAVMMMLEYYCNHYNSKYKGKTYKQLFNETCFYVVPMANPDGVTIAQYGPSAIKDSKLRKKVKAGKKKYSYSNWKSNARGVDLNRNYTLYNGWPSGSKYYSENYPGSKAFSEKETQGIKKLIDSTSNLKAVINYHQMGQVIYWGYGNSKVKSKCVKFANAMASTTGYRLINESRHKSTGDLEHYTIHQYKVPYVCIETGHSGVPVSISQLKRIYNQIDDTMPIAANMFY